MIRVHRTHRVFAAVLVAAALIAAACEIEPVVEPPLEVATTTTMKPAPPAPVVTTTTVKPAPPPPVVTTTTVKPAPPAPVATTTPPATTAPPSTTMPPSGGSGMPYVDPAAIPTGSAGTGEVRVGTGAGAPATDDIQGAIVMICDFSHMNFDDPIVFPGVRNATHLHSFFGNTGTDFRSTAESIRSSGNSTCRGGILNRSSYWVPSLIDTRSGTPIAPREVVIYYTHGNLPGPEIQAHPAGLRILAGRASSSAAQPHINWYCPNTGTYSGGISTNCRSDQYIKMSIVFPQCWNGRDLDSPDHASHMAYSTRSGGCPSSHPVPVPQLNLSAIWDLGGQPLSALRLSSDMYSTSAPGGYSGHADWFDGWDQATKETFIRECVHREVYCFAQLGDGRSLQR